MPVAKKPATASKSKAAYAAKKKMEADGTATEATKATKAPREVPPLKEAAPPEPPPPDIMGLMEEHREQAATFVRKNPDVIPAELVRDARLDPLIKIASEAHAALQTAEAAMVESRAAVDKLRRIIRRSPIPSN